MNTPQEMNTLQNERTRNQFGYEFSGEGMHSLEDQYERLAEGYGNYDERALWLRMTIIDFSTIVQRLGICREQMSHKGVGERLCDDMISQTEHRVVEIIDAMCKAWQKEDKEKS